MKQAVEERDFAQVCNDSAIDFRQLENTTILITGATGLIGYNLICTLLFAQRNIKILALVRNISKAKQMYAPWQCELLQFVVGDVKEPIEINESIDYVIHAANETSSKAFVNSPVDTIATAVQGTQNMLELAVKHQVKSFVYLSSMEVYGAPKTTVLITESTPTTIDTMQTRSCYPESKRLCESLCKAYQVQYGLSTKVLRLTQTFGVGVPYDDARVFAEFARCAIEKRDIVLHTKGETERSYLYTADAVSAILIALLKGAAGEAYNVANESTYCSIYDMACMVEKHCANDGIAVRCEVTEDIQQYGYAEKLCMNLGTSKMQALGWKPQLCLVDMFQNLCGFMRESKETT